MSFGWRASTPDAGVEDQASSRPRYARGKKAPRETTRYRDALSKAFAKHAAFRALRIRESSGKVSFQGIPNASLRTFADVVLEAALPK